MNENVGEIALDEIGEEFGREVAELVVSASEHDKSTPWRERK